MKKILMIFIVCFLFLCGCDNITKEKNNEDVKIGEIQGINESTKEIPDFTIVVRGLVETVITDESIKNLTMYDFETDVRVSDLDSNPEITHDSWTGVKLSDVLTSINITGFDSIDFRASGNITVRYSKKELDNEMYLIFYRNGVSLSETEKTPVMLFVPSLKNRYWVPSLTRIDIL